MGGLEPAELAQLALEKSGYVDASSVILDLGDAAAWQPSLIREAMEATLENPPSQNTQRALRLLFYAYEEAIRRAG
jgi:hypothetical protein